MHGNPKRVHRLILVSLLGLLLASSLPAEQPRPEANWENLKQVTADDDLRVILTDGRSYNAKMQTYSESAVVVRTITGEQTFAREDVLRISAKGRSHRMRNALIGAGITFGAIFGAGAAHAASLRKEYPQNRWTEVGAGVGAVFAPVGAAVGAALTPGGWHVVYRAR